MPTLYSRALGLMAMFGITACDPIYTLGMRQRLAPPPTMDCLEATLQTSPRLITVTRLDERVETGFQVIMRDTTARTGQRNATIELETGPDSTQTLSMAYHWMASAGNVPFVEQRRMLALATEVLEELRAACAPNATTKGECFAPRRGGLSACQAPPPDSIATDPAAGDSIHRGPHDPRMLLIYPAVFVLLPRRR